MTRELFVSSTPHETKVGLTEDDQLAEIYLERENEYTLAGSIYKGRVTRVLPGMQSAFVDIGLERDAFLYVSDFMEVEEGDEVEDVPTNRPVMAEPKSEPRNHPAPQAAATGTQSLVIEGPDFPEESEGPAEPQAEAAAQPGNESDAGDQQEGRGGNWRNRRRRRGRRGERMPESKFARPAEPQREAAPGNDRPERNERPARNERDDYGPPPGYQPILLPGESISKYQRMAQKSAAPAQYGGQGQATGTQPARVPSVAENFPEDEPLFAETEEHVAEAAPVENQKVVPIAAEMRRESHDRQSEEAWDREQKRQHEMNVAAVFGSSEGTEEGEDQTEEVLTAIPEISDHAPAAAQVEASAGTMEQEEIEEEEADLAHYTENLDEEDAFEELEEETHAADDYQEHPTHAIAASAEPVVEETTAHVEPLAEGLELDEAAAEAAAEEEEEAEIEEAQAEAEALLDAEMRGNGSVDARVEVRAPAATAAYTQRPARPAFDRRGGGQRGRRGGRRFQRQRAPQPVPQISDLLKEGQEVLVQIAKEPIGKKGARITSHIALPGRFLVYMPTVNHTGVSRKISSEEERQRLKRIILSERENGHGGFIVRTAAQGANEEELRADIRFLKGLWSEIKTRSENGKAPALIYHDLNVVERVLRDQVTSDFSAIWVDNEQEYERILRFANRFQPALVRRVKLYTKETPLFEQFGLKDEIDKALKSKVWLKSGGYIVINQTEALVAIDVNTGKYVGKTSRLEDTIVKTNVDAIKEIVRQIRLRDLGGIIIIDFIDMDERRNRQKVMQALEEALRADRAPSKVLQFNDFGLVAITRKRVKQSLERTIGSPCPYCQSTGFVKSVTTICNEIYLEMRKISKHLEHSDVMLRVNPEVAKVLKANGGKGLLEMEEMTKKTVIVKSDPALHQEQFDIT
jgi:ribonuclease G